MPNLHFSSDMQTAGGDWADVPSKLGMHGITGPKMNSRNGNMGNGQGSRTPGSMMVSRKSEVMEATTRDTKSGMTKGHGAGMQTDVQRFRRWHALIQFISHDYPKMNK